MAGEAAGNTNTGAAAATAAEPKTIEARLDAIESALNALENAQKPEPGVTQEQWNKLVGVLKDHGIHVGE